MPGRILTLQRQVRELGRLRAGLSVPSSKPGKMRPASSPNWILTSPNRDYIDAAATLWGGQPELWQPLGNRPKVWRVITDQPQIPAILPPGDPLSQHYEMWSAGGCQRRCDGEREQRSDQPCLCRAEFGEDFHLQTKEARCQIHTRLSVFLPDLPDIGQWRIETHGYWPSVHITGYVELIKAQVGDRAMVPVTLGIEPRTKVANGQTSQYVEIVVALGTRTPLGEILASPQVLAIGGPADSRVIEQAPTRPALESAGAVKTRTPAEWRANFAQAQTLDELRSMGDAATRDGAANDEETKAAYRAAGDRIVGRPAAAHEPEPEPDEQAASWAHLIRNAATLEVLRGVWGQMKEAGLDDKALNRLWWERKSAITGEPLPDAAPAEEVAEQEPDRDMTWSAIMAAAGPLGWNTDDVMTRFHAHSGKEAADGTGWDYAAFLDAMRTGALQ